MWLLARLLPSPKGTPSIVTLYWPSLKPRMAALVSLRPGPLAAGVEVIETLGVALDERAYDIVIGRGLLTGRIRTIDDMPANDRRRRHPRFQPENLARNVGLVAQLDVMAKAKGVSSSQLAIAFLLAQGDHIIPIPGTNHIANLEQNVAAVDINLSAAETRKLSDIFAPGSGAGERYVPNALKGVWL